MDYQALYDVLEAKKIGGAILDTFPDGCWGFKLECGPPFGEATFPFQGKGNFKDLDNVQLTPNVMMQTQQFFDNSAA